VNVSHAAARGGAPAKERQEHKPSPQPRGLRSWRSSVGACRPAKPADVRHVAAGGAVHCRLRSRALQALRALRSSSRARSGTAFCGLCGFCV